jgi:hypothetical protein
MARFIVRKTGARSRYCHLNVKTAIQKTRLPSVSDSTRKPFGELEVARIASEAGELNGAAANRIDVGDAVRHFAPGAIGGFAARMRKGIELESDTGRSTGGSFGTSDPAVPSRDVGDIAKICPDMLRAAADVD